MSPITKMYAGQTDDFRVRERSRQDYVATMGVPLFNVCFKHSLDNEYHRDALEVALIAYNFLIFGCPRSTGVRMAITGIPMSNSTFK